ncbi:uncharacterized protein isoform X2 [Salmo salar]|uniref:Uncharacterized protein isoform X2 n=1 Tax=Salmo salar TaxID=8030 RepID=A0A1S3P4X7_SALSA|nr:uncharacterized protein LOC106583230 isoform X2 [Salmo salar]|eukprot:XP_014022639.1 PREDICTED: uncharacterized protein LOC106583230 isoform X2 [Salmo salar]
MMRHGCAQAILTFLVILISCPMESDCEEDSYNSILQDSPYYLSSGLTNFKRYRDIHDDTFVGLMGRRSAGESLGLRGPKEPLFAGSWLFNMDGRVHYGFMQIHSRFIKGSLSVTNASEDKFSQMQHLDCGNILYSNMQSLFSGVNDLPSRRSKIRDMDDVFVGLLGRRSSGSAIPQPWREEVYPQPSGGILIKKGRLRFVPGV